MLLATIWKIRLLSISKIDNELLIDRFNSMNFRVMWLSNIKNAFRLKYISPYKLVVCPILVHVTNEQGLVACYKKVKHHLNDPRCSPGSLEESNLFIFEALVNELFSNRFYFLRRVYVRPEGLPP